MASLEGEPGEPGKDGADGKTPVKGVDYFTPNEVQEIAEQAAEMVEVPEGGSGIEITGAKVGQTVKIAEVDENGVPTAWEPQPSGVVETVRHITLEESVAHIFIDTDEDGNPFKLAHYEITVYIPANADITTNTKLQYHLNYNLNNPTSTGGSQVDPGYTIVGTTASKHYFKSLVNFDKSNPAQYRQYGFAAVSGNDNAKFILYFVYQKMERLHLYLASGAKFAVGTVVTISGVRV